MVYKRKPGDGTTYETKGRVAHAAEITHIQADPASKAAIQWNEAGVHGWLRLAVAIECKIKQKRVPAGKKSRRTRAVSGVFVLRNSWNEVAEEGGLDELRESADAALCGYLAMMEED